MSLRPRYAEAILEGRKRVEFRRSAYPSRARRVAIYVTTPVRAIVGVFEIDGIDRDIPAELWSRHGDLGALSHEEFLVYYQGAGVGAAIRIGAVMPLRAALALRDIDPKLTPPQSLCYLSRSASDRLLAELI